jgi:flagellar biosynthetic protein FlhB
MTAEDGESGEKQHDPTEKRIEEARRQGDVPQSRDLVTAAAFGGLMLVCLVEGERALRRIGQACAWLLGNPDRISGPSGEGKAVPVLAVLAECLWAVAPLFLVPAAAALLALLAQRALIFAPDRIMPRLSRLSPLASLTHKFGREGLFEFAKGTVKMALVTAVLGAFLVSRTDEVLGSLALQPAQAVVLLLQLSLAFLGLVLLLSTAIGGIDLVWQRTEFLRRNRMSRQDLIDEMKQSEGDPHMKSVRQGRAQEIATNRMLRDVPKADVIVVNPTHYAIALVWKRDEHAAPVCVAKGRDAVAARIRDLAIEAGVPIHRDPPTARALHATVAIGEAIRPEHYRAVAAAIRFSEAMRTRARRRG